MGKVKVVARSSNAKLGWMACTYAPLQTCAKDCPLQRWCYGMEHWTGKLVSQLTTAAQGCSPEELAAVEAAAIDQLPARYPLRVHVVGDCPTATSATIIGQAMSRFEARTGQPAWTYTHAWYLPAAAWGQATVRASCESWDLVEQAQANGYHLVALVANTVPPGTTPCPHYVNNVKCVDCRLCRQEDIPVIVFPPHGSRRKKLERALNG